MSRTRERTNSYFAGGSVTIGNTTTKYGGGVSDFERCIDTVHSGPPYISESALRLTKLSANPVRLSATPKAWNIVQSKVDVPAGYSAHTAPLPSPPNWGTISTKALAKVNPNRGDFSALNFIAELREIPSMIKNVGSALLNPANLYLLGQFGVKPLLQDLSTLISIQSEIESKLEGLDFKDRKVEGIVGNSQHFFPTSVIWAHHPLTTKLHYLNTEKQKHWFSGNFKLISPKPEFNGVSATLAALDFGQPIKQVWNSVPWTFLIDYFLNVANYLEATEGNLKFQLTEVSLMANHVVESKFTGDSKGWSTNQHFVAAKTEYKFREIWPVARPRLIFDPVLTGQQLSNLGALILANHPFRYRFG